MGAGNLNVRQPSNGSLDLSSELLPELSEFNSAVDINQFLARLLVLVAKGRVSPRRASVLAYVTNQLPHSHRAITLDNLTRPQQATPLFDFSDWPDPMDGSGIERASDGAPR